MDAGAEKAMEQQERQDANLLLERNYRRQFRKDPAGLKESIDVLDDMLQDLPAHIYHRAIKDHILDAEIGQWFPQPANVNGKAATALESYRRQAKEREEGLISETHDVYNEAKSKKIPISDPYLIGALGKSEVDCIPDSFFRCKECGDTGWVVFYHFITKREIVYSSLEYNKMYDSENRHITLKMRSASATCGCDVGYQIETRYHDNPPHLRPPCIFTINKLITKRKARVARATQGELSV